ncbi:hypothetical protein K227x_52070 [Rubripirellula lacrimiformis]|uniref:Uncharacterized protein n=1 Tax=Rubripirellula lacrimiformis TaxID=1930273 RepID=A0A517NI32_9BACT|nr:hypothetical protein K227x_52070 [Rubripirellula lacrimiformis]
MCRYKRDDTGRQPMDTDGQPKLVQLSQVLLA